MNLRNLASLTLALGAVVGGCADGAPNPTSTHLPPVTRDAPAPGDPELAIRLSGSASVSIREAGAGPGAGRVLATERGTWSAVVASRHGVSGEITLGGRSLPSSIAFLASRTPRQGEFECRSRARGGRPERVARFRAAGGAPVSHLELVRGGEVVGTIATSWTRVEGAWVASRRVTTLYQGGRPARAIEVSLAEPAIERDARGVLAASLSVGAGPPAATYDDDGGGPCQAEVDAAFDALDLYWAADASLITCFLGAKACATAIIAVIGAARRVDVTQERLNRCVAAI